MANQVHIPEVYEPDEKLPADLVTLRKFAKLMDEAVRIPGTKRGVGLDAALGLIPGVGDVVSGAMSAWIIAGALRHRVPLRHVLRMIWNVVVDVVFGAVPVAGDIFDVLFEENVRNMQLLMKHRNRQLPPRRTSEIAAAVVLITIFIIGFTIAVVGAVFALIVWLAAQRNS